MNYNNVIYTLLKNYQMTSIESSVCMVGERETLAVNTCLFSKLAINRFA